MNKNELILLDAGLFIGALLKKDPRHKEARSIVEKARQGKFLASTTTSILSEVYAALTWVNAKPPHSPTEAANAVRLLVDPPSEIKILPDGFKTCKKMLELSQKYELTARRVHDARHAATALTNGVTSIYTYDVVDWKVFVAEGLRITGPASVLVIKQR
jgi:predicted nucleic acid-binding protein